MLVRSTLVRTATAFASAMFTMLVGLHLRGIGQDDRHAEGSGLGQVAIVRVALDHDDALALRDQAAYDADADRTQTRSR